MTYRIELVKQAVKDYEEIQKADREAVKKAILTLEKNPRGHQVKKLEGREFYRLRVGDWRIIFAVSDKLRVVTVITIERRSERTYS